MEPTVSTEVRTRTYRSILFILFGLLLLLNVAAFWIYRQAHAAESLCPPESTAKTRHSVSCICLTMARPCAECIPMESPALFTFRNCLVSTSTRNSLPSHWTTGSNRALSFAISTTSGRRSEGGSPELTNRHRNLRTPDTAPGTCTAHSCGS